jgi:hypothetical protein
MIAWQSYVSQPESPARAAAVSRPRIAGLRQLGVEGARAEPVHGGPGVYVAADRVTAAKRGIRSGLAAHLAALGTLGRERQLTADVTVLRRDVYATRRDSFRFVGVGALLGRGTSRAKAASSRSNESDRAICQAERAILDWSTGHADEERRRWKRGTRLVLTRLDG